MNKRIRTLIPAVLAAVMTLGMGAGVLAQSVPSDSTATGTITLQVHESANNLWVGVTVGSFETAQAGSASSGQLDMAVEDDRPNDQTDWYVSAQISEFTSSDGQNSFFPVGNAVLWENVSASGGNAITGAPIGTAPTTVWTNTNGGKVASATATGTGIFTVPDDTATGNYSSTVTVTITGTDPNA
jgi:hypothetical protein